MKAGSSLVVFFLAVIPAVGGERPRLDPAALAKEIDRRVNEKLKAQQVSPAPRADDATFFRRINLALAGRIPAPAEVRTFLADSSPDKRAKAIDRLLNSAEFASHLTTSWRSWLIPEAATNPDIANTVQEFEAWLNGRIRAEASLDKIAAELLTYPLDGRQVPGQSPNDGTTGPLVFYRAKEAKPENLAAATARVFLGVRLECAQCHNHPFARWKKEQFWGLAAFFAGVEQQSGGGLRETLGRRELLLPNSDQAAPATFLDDREPEWQYKKSPRVTLAAWLTTSENPFFARAMANRFWWWLFGVGLVEAVDDFHDQNPPSHPELLDELARALAQSGFDTKYLLRAICLSDTFGRASTVADREHQDVRLFAHFALRALSPEQLYDSLALAIGSPPEKQEATDRQRADNGRRRQFLETFASSEQPTAAPTSILQALTLMNGELVNSASKGQTFDALMARPDLKPAERVEALYLAVLSRPPQQRELQRALRHIETGGADQVKARYGDVFWALLNSLEFRTNH